MDKVCSAWSESQPTKRPRITPCNLLHQHDHDISHNIARQLSNITLNLIQANEVRNSLDRQEAKLLLAMLARSIVDEGAALGDVVLEAHAGGELRHEVVLQRGHQATAAEAPELGVGEEGAAEGAEQLLVVGGLHDAMGVEPVDEQAEDAGVDVVEKHGLGDAFEELAIEGCIEEGGAGKVGAVSNSFSLLSSFLGLKVERVN